MRSLVEACSETLHQTRDKGSESMQLLILTGMSGAGKSSALKILEDIGFLCVDNLPIALLPAFASMAAGKEDKRVAVGIDIRNADAITDLRGALEEMGPERGKVRILFLDADDEMLIKRYKETRRTHPLAEGRRVEEAIADERERIGFLREKADYIIDTTHLLVRELKAELERIFVEDRNFKNLFITVLSFGFKYGIPADADLVFDVRFLPNPYYIEHLRPMTGNDSAVRDYIYRSPDAETFVEKTSDLIGFLLPRYVAEGKTSLVIAFGCTGGKHRSVCMANAVMERLQAACSDSYGMKIEHRDIDKDKKIGK